MKATSMKSLLITVFAIAFAATVAGLIYTYNQLSKSVDEIMLQQNTDATATPAIVKAISDLKPTTDQIKELYFGDNYETAVEKTINDYAKESEFKVDKVTTAQSDSPTIASEIQINNASYLSINISINQVISYSQLRQFMHRIEKGTPLMQVNHLTINGSDGGVRVVTMEIGAIKR